MVTNYKEAEENIPPGEAERYACGIGVMDAVADVLHNQGLLPDKFAQVRSAETITLEAFLKGKRRETHTIGGKLPLKLGEELNQKGRKLSQSSSDILSRINTLKSPEKIDLVWVAVQDLGLPKGGTFQEITRKAHALGFLRKCPAEVGPHLRLADDNQPMNIWYTIAMDPIADRDGNPSVFYLGCRADGLWLGDGWTDPDVRWDPASLFVFALRKQ